MSLVGSQEKAFQARDVALLLDLLSEQAHETEKGCAIALNGLSEAEFAGAMVRGAAVVGELGRIVPVRGKRWVQMCSLRVRLYLKSQIFPTGYLQTPWLQN